MAARAVRFNAAICDKPESAGLAKFGVSWGTAGRLGGCRARRTGRCGVFGQKNFRKLGSSGGACRFNARVFPDGDAEVTELLPGGFAVCIHVGQEKAKAVSDRMRKKFEIFFG